MSEVMQRHAQAIITWLSVTAYLVRGAGHKLLTHARINPSRAQLSTCVFSVTAYRVCSELQRLCTVCVGIPCGRVPGTQCTAKVVCITEGIKGHA
jgi:hypothetical protein